MIINIPATFLTPVEARAKKLTLYYLKGSYTDRRLSVTENTGNLVINEATMVTPSKLKGGIFTLRGSETAQNDR